MGPRTQKQAGKEEQTNERNEVEGRNQRGLRLCTKTDVINERSVDELFRLEVVVQIEHLPDGECDDDSHREQREQQHTRVGRLVRVAHLLLARLHVSEVVHNRLGEVLESPQLHLCDLNV